MSEEQPPQQEISGAGGIEPGEAFGIPVMYEKAREEWLREGYLRALARSREASQHREDPDFRRETFIPLYEALAFAGSLIERVLEPRRKSDERPTEERKSMLQGVRYVRNAVLHQWSLALVGRDVPQTPPIVVRAGGSRRTGPTVVFDWFWRPLAEIPVPDTKKVGKDQLGRDSYEDYLAAEPARFALEEIERTLSGGSPA